MRSHRLLRFSDIDASVIAPTVRSFIIWSHGMEFSCEMLEEIGHHGEILRVRAFHWFRPLAPSLIGMVYQYDPSPMIHLSAKARYLKNHKQRALLVFTSLSEEADYAQIKARLRDLFPASLVSGAGGHDHLFHAADSSWDSWRLLRILEGQAFWHRAVNAFVRGDTSLLNSYPKAAKQLQKLPIDLLLVTVLTSRTTSTLMQVHETPHFKYLEGNSHLYREYLRENMGYGIRAFHSQARFDRLGQLSKSNPIQVRQKGTKFVVLDGAHRVAIAKHAGEEFVDAEIV